MTMCIFSPTRAAASLAIVLATAASPALAGQITIVNDGTQEVGFQIFDGKTYVDSGRVRPPAGTQAVRTVPNKKITVVLWRSGTGKGGAIADADRCQVDFASGSGIVHVTMGKRVTCRLART